MKQKFTLIFLIISFTASARIFYTAPNGNDNNAGTISAPFFSLTKAWSNIQPGDTIYMRGGTYIFNTQQLLTGKNGTAGNLISIFNYPGENAIITRATTFVKPTGERGMIHLKGNYTHWRGIELTGMYTDNGQIDCGLVGLNSSNNIFELINSHHNVGGLYLEGNSNNNLVLNSDFHDNYDNYGGSNGGNSDGLDIAYCTGNGNIIRGCRSWNNGDDGFDNYENSGTLTLENSWSWHNGYYYGTSTPAGNGVGYKLGSTFIAPSHGVLKRRIQNNLFWDNRDAGIHINGADLVCEVFNNVMYGNHITGMNFHYANNPHVFRNNVSFGNTDKDVEISSASSSMMNSAGTAYNDGGWTTNASAADFMTLNFAGADGPRNADGSLPVLSFLHLAGTSDLIDAGLNVGLPFIGSSPDRGDFEFGISLPNLPPVANAGPNVNITLPITLFTLTGSGTDADGSIISFLWTKISGPLSVTINTPALSVTTGVALLPGNYEFELKVTDNQGAVAKDTVQLTVNGIAANQPPTANAGADRNITLPTNSITQTGSGTDADGTIASYQWTKIAGPATFTIVAPAQAQTVINNLVQGVYQFELNVTDNNGATGKDTVVVTVNAAAANQPPSANAGADKNITLPTNSITQTGSGNDPDGTITSYQWSKIAGPATFTIVSPAQAQTVINNLVQGVYQFELNVTDNNGATGKDTVTVTVNAAPANQLPVANAGPDRNITLPTNSITQTGSGTDPDGTITSYQWTKIAGPATFTIVSPTQAQTVINNLVQGVYQFEFKVTDNNGGIGKDTIIVTVNPAIIIPNQLPTANAGSDRNITLPTNSITQTGSGTDPDGTIASYQWTKITGPATFTIISPAQAQTVINNLVQGVYQFELKVTDNNGGTGKDTMIITVNAAPANQLPTVNAGADITITLPVNSVTVNGTASDADGSIASYQWTKIAGPSSYAVSAATSASTGISNLTQGVYQFELKVTDNQGAVAMDIIIITVNSAVVIVNRPPVVKAGTDSTIILPDHDVTLEGTATDPDNNISSYAWRKITGPVQFRVAAVIQGEAMVTDLVEGIYVFELKATDAMGATGIDTVTVTVLHEPTDAFTAKLYPNPAVSVLHIEINAEKNMVKTSVEVFDMTGKMMLHQEAGRNQQSIQLATDVTRYPAGTYFVKIMTDRNMLKTMTFIKQ